jgi:hypothetical protein
MKHLAIGAVISLDVLSTTNHAHAAACVNGVYRAGCTGPNGTAVIRKPPPVHRHVTCANGVYRAGGVGPNGLLASANDPGAAALSREVRGCQHPLGNL